jgi:site-specific recombinase XerD
MKLSTAELARHIENFLSEYLIDKQPETAGTYKRALNEFQRWFVRYPKFQFKEEDIEAYKSYLMEDKKLHQVSVSTYLTSVRRLCAYFVAIGLLEENPARKVKGNRRPRDHSRPILNAQDVETLFENVIGEKLLEKRDRAILYAMLYAGLGEIELIRANLEDLQQDSAGNWLIWVQGKGRTGKDQSVIIEDNVMEKIRIYLDARGLPRPESPLFVSHGHRSDGERLNTRSVRGRINFWLKNAGLKDKGITPHSLTHTAALLWFNQGMPIEEVKQRMRHGTLDTTMIYFRQQGLLEGMKE